MVSVLDSGSSDLGSSTGWGHCVVFLGKTLYSRGAGRYFWQVTVTGHKNCAPKRNMFLLKILYFRASLVLLVLFRLFLYCFLGQISHDLYM